VTHRHDPPPIAQNPKEAGTYELKIRDEMAMIDASRIPIRDGQSCEENGIRDVFHRSHHPRDRVAPLPHFSADDDLF
jgi:hypothetical protein